MQIKGLPRNLLRLINYTERHPDRDSPEAIKVRFWQQLKSEGVSDEACADIVGICHPTFYRYRHKIKTKQAFKKKPRQINRPQWGESEKQRVLEIHRKTGYGNFNAKRFLLELVGQACESLKIPLIVLPPSKLQYNITVVLKERIVPCVKSSTIKPPC